MTDASIKHVSDTAIWVAYFRAEETKRHDALFKDPFAEKLIGARGEAIAKSMPATSEYTRQNVVIRTYIIDTFIRELVASGVDTVINLGAGLDTRPYRMSLPASVRWVEVDYPHVIEMKSSILASELPSVSLERVSLDLADKDTRRTLFSRLASQSKRAVVLTEGVLPYLTPEDVSSLAADLHAETRFESWICDYMSPETYKYLANPKRMERMKNAPFRFFPPNPFEFFTSLGWSCSEIRYIQKTTEDLGRPSPLPWFARLMKPFFPPAVRERLSKMSGYMILRRV